MLSTSYAKYSKSVCWSSRVHTCECGTDLGLPQDLSTLTELRLLRLHFAGEGGPGPLTLAPQLPSLRFLSLQQRGVDFRMRDHDLRCIPGVSRARPANGVCPDRDLPTGQLHCLHVNCCMRAH